MEINEVKYGFKLISVEKMEDINSTLYQYEHLKSGGKVAYLANDDTNCCFAIGFRTLPEDSTGVCHIIEHSVLCGSKRFPLKEPFVNLIKSSLATFLNAFTAYDWTMYPFSSQTPKDFHNILEIYLDAVFNPISMENEKPFLQEGWHLELNDVNDTPSYKGVVYNEMKGAMSSVDEVLVQSTLEAMYKDTFYRFNSGGDPEVIPTLTYQAYKDFYHKHYTPQNAMTYFYGDLDIEEKLKYLDENYFSKYEKVEEEIIIKAQEPFVDLSYEKDYEIGADEDVKDNTYMSLCYGLDHYNNYELMMAMNVLTDALLSKNDSYLKKALLEANLGQNVECRIDDDNIVPALHIYLQKSNKENKEKFKQVFEDAVRTLVNEGIDKELLLASINHLEFKDKELDMGRMPKGLIFAMTMMGSFNYHGELKDHLEFAKYYDKFKKELHNNYFENILETYILNSKHHVQVVINPSKTLGEQKAIAMKEKMEELKNTLTLKEKEELVKQTKDLIEYQNHVDTKEELATLPSLKIKDIPDTINYLDSKDIKVNGIKGFAHEISTNKIAYLRMYFDVKKVAFEDLPYVLLLKQLLLNVKTTKYDVATLNKLVKTYLGDLSFSTSVTSKKGNDYSFLFKVSSSALLENANYMNELINEVLNHSRFSKKEVLVIVKQLANGLKQGIIENGMAVAMNEAKSAYSIESALVTSSLMGPKVYNFFNDLANNYNHRVVNRKLKEVASLLFNKKNVVASISGDEETLDVLKGVLRKIRLPRKQQDNKLVVSLDNVKNDALVIPSGVSYNAFAYNLKELGETFTGKYLVLSHIVTYDYLWAEIRVKGGAYGNALVISNNGDISFGSYRDPNVVNTYKVFSNAWRYLANFKANRDEFKSYIIGTMGNFDSPSSTPSLINTWDINYINGFSKQDKVNLKNEVLNTKIGEVRKCRRIFKKMRKLASIYTIGNEAKIKEYPFKNVKSI